MLALKPQHRRRLREVWRSAGWPCHDAVELELLAAGLLQRHWDAAGRETLHLSEAGLQALAAARRQAQTALSAHEALVACVAAALAREGRLVWRGPALRAPLAAAAPGSCAVADARPVAEPPALWSPGLAAENPGYARAPARRWALVRPDVFSIRHTTQEDQTDPMVHEIKVSRADLLADLRNADKGAAYRALSGRCWYVLRAGIAEPDEVPAEYGVLIAHENAPQGGPAQRLTLARAAPHRPQRLPFAAWMALARLGAERPDATAWPAAAPDGDAWAPGLDADAAAQAPLAAVAPCAPAGEAAGREPTP